MKREWRLARGRKGIARPALVCAGPEPKRIGQAGLQGFRQGRLAVLGENDVWPNTT